MILRQIYDQYLAQYSYLVGCKATGQGLIIDPQRDIDRYFPLAAQEGLAIVAVTETHIHADFLSGAREFAEQHGTKLYLSDEGEPEWKYSWTQQTDYKLQLLKHGDTFRIGTLEIKALHTPGHTPEHLSFLLRDLVGTAKEPMGIITGDFVFVGDLGRPDLLETAVGLQGVSAQSARALLASVKDFINLPDYLQVWPGHGAGSACGKAPGAMPVSTVGYEIRYNEAILKAGKSEADFIQSLINDQNEPPLYFARMKELNQNGQPLLPKSFRLPPRLETGQIPSIINNENGVIIDLRPDPHDFMKAHLPGSLHIPLSKTFPKAAGSFILPDQEIVLVTTEVELEEAVRNLLRIGLDHVTGYLRPEQLETDSGSTSQLAFTETSEMTSLTDYLESDESQILDVRNKPEHLEAHLPGALNIPYTRLRERLSEIPADKKLIVHCQSGRSASSAASYLTRQGYDVIYVAGEFKDLDLAN